MNPYPPRSGIAVCPHGARLNPRARSPDRPATGTPGRILPPYAPRAAMTPKGVHGFSSALKMMHPISKGRPAFRAIQLDTGLQWEESLSTLPPNPCTPRDLQRQSVTDCAL